MPPCTRYFFNWPPPLQQVISVLAIGTTAIGHRVPVEPSVMNILCELINTRKEFVANPAGDIDILLGMESCGLLLKAQPLDRTPIMRDLSVTKSPLSSLLTIKGAIGGLEGDGPANCVHTIKTYTEQEAYLSDLHSTAIALMAAKKLPTGMDSVDLMLTEARLWMRAAGYDPADRGRIVYSDSVSRPPPLSCKAVAAKMSSNKRPEEDDEGGGSSSGGARGSPPPRAPVRQSHPTTPSSRPQTIRDLVKELVEGVALLVKLLLPCFFFWP